MNKKMITIIAAIAGILFVVVVGLLIFNHENIDWLSQLIPDTTENGKVPGGSGNKDDQQTQTEEQDRELHFDNYIKVEYSEDSMLENPEEVGVDNVYYVTQNPVSNGFVVTPSKNLELNINLGTSAVLRGIDYNAIIEISEVSPVDFSIQQLRIEYLNNYGFNYHASLDTNPIPHTAYWNSDTGLYYWEDFYNDTQLFNNPTISGNMFLVTDEITKTAYGNAMFIMLYDSVEKEYCATALITTMNNTRVLKITMEHMKDSSHAWSYLIEVTNDCIKLVK